MIRQYTNKLLDVVDMDMIDRQFLIEQLLSWLSEDDVKEFWYANGYDEELDDED